MLDLPRKAEPEPETQAAEPPDLGDPRTPDTQAPDTQAVVQIAHLQKDGLLLLTHLAENSSRSLVAGTGAPEDQVDPGMLTAPPAEIAADGAKFRRLLRTVDALATSAAPATTTTIRLTCAYLSGASSQVSQSYVARAANLRRWLNGIRLALLAAVLLSVALLMHVDDGRRVIGQMAAVRTDLDRTYGDLAKLDRAQDFDLEIFFAPGATEPVPKPEKGTLEFLLAARPGDPAGAEPRRHRGRDPQGWGVAAGPGQGAVAEPLQPAVPAAAAGGDGLCPAGGLELPHDRAGRAGEPGGPDPHGLRRPLRGPSHRPVPAGQPGALEADRAARQ